MQYFIFHFANEKHLSNIPVYDDKLMKFKSNNALTKFRICIVRRWQIPMWAYNATIPKYVHFHQVTLSCMKKGVVSVTQTTDVKHPETQESKAPRRRYAIRDHAACTEIEGLVTWKQEAEGLS